MALGVIDVEPSQETKTQLALVTGASGFIGKHLCNALLNKGYKVRALLRDGSHCANFPQAIESVNGDLADKAALATAAKDVDIIFHAAAIAHVRVSAAQLLQETNVEGTRNILQAGQAANVPGFVFFSSILAEQPDSVYASSKQQAEQLVLECADNFQSVMVLRPVNVYGVGMKGNIAGLIRRISKGSLPPLPRLGNRLSLVGVQDLCNAAVLVAEKPAAAGQTYPVTDGQAYTPNSLETSIYAALGRKKPGWHCPRVVFYAASLGAQLLNSLGVWSNDLGLRTYCNLVHNKEASCEKISTELGYQPTQSLADELPAIIAALD